MSAQTDAEYAAMTLPRSGSCEVTDTEARMNVEYFDQLLEYSASLPTGTFVGKRWKAQRNDRDKNDRVWFLCEYVEDPDPKLIGIQRRRIMQVRP
jgi:hypothetical protein